MAAALEWCGAAAPWPVAVEGRRSAPVNACAHPPSPLSACCMCARWCSSSLLSPHLVSLFCVGVERVSPRWSFRLGVFWRAVCTIHCAVPVRVPVLLRVCAVCVLFSSMTAAPLYYWWSLGAHIFRGLFQAQTKYANTHLLFFPFYRITNKQISSIRRWAFAAQRTIIYVCVARELLSFTQMWRRKNKRVVPAATQALRMCHCAQPAVRSRRPAYLSILPIFF